MEAQSNDDDLSNSDSSSSRSDDDRPAAAPESSGSDRWLKVEDDEDDGDLLKYSSWTTGLSKNPDIEESSLESLDLLPFDLTERPLQRVTYVEEETSALALLFETNELNDTLEKGVGLANLGNTCFINAVLQCFLHTVPLLHAVLSDTHAIICHCSGEEFCLLCAVRELVELSLANSNKIIRPWKIVNNLSYFCSSFEWLQQEDAHEFLQCFLDRLESSRHNSKQTDSTSSERVNFVNQVFRGCVVSKLKCCNCDHCSDTYEPSVDLSLEIQNATNLLTALESFTRVERIEDPENMFTCENCKKQVPINKQLAFYQAPSVAAFHLKRFKNDGCLVEKIDDHVAFPLELDMLPFTCGGETNSDELKYRLYAIVVHSGSSSTSGHYYCFIRISPGIWLKFDDSWVVQVREDLVLSQEAYILFYAKESIPWFSTFAAAQKSLINSKIVSTSPISVLDKAREGYSREADEASCAAAAAAADRENELGCNASASDYLDLFSHESQSNDTPIPDVGARIDIKTLDLQTPPRSPSPEIYKDDPPDIVFSIEHKKARPVSRRTCKRQLDKDLDDSETRQACSLIKKSMPGARGKQLLAALKGSKSEVSGRSKKSRNSNSSSRFDDMRPVFPSLLAGGLR